MAREFKTLAAGAGWELAEFIGCDGMGDDFLAYSTIIAWDIELEWNEEDAWEPRIQLVTPITLGGNSNRGLYWMIKRPDGKFELDEETRDTEEDALLYLRWRYERDHPALKIAE